MNIDKLFDEVIPPSDYRHRNGFNNAPIIDELKENERLALEKALIQKLQLEVEGKIDSLIIETLAYLKSVASLSILKKLLEGCNDINMKLRLATSIFEINHDVEMVDIAVTSVKQMDDKKDAYYIYKLTSAFYYLAKIDNEKAKYLLEEYTSHPEYLISYNAKQALEMKLKI